MARTIDCVCLALVTTLAGACAASPSPTTTTTLSTSVPPSTTTTRPACQTWAAAQSGTGAAAGTAQAGYRASLLSAGGGVRTVGSRSYAMWFPSGWASTSPRRVIFGLHGTGGSGEEDWWFNWKDAVAARSWAYVGLTYVNGSGDHDDEPTAYTNIKSLMDELRASCDFGSPSIFLVGFSRGSAMTFGVSYLDLKDRRFFKAFGENSGAWPQGTNPSATVQGIADRNESTAYADGQFWMYCGERDFTHGGGMCDEMATAQAFVTRYGGSVRELFHDPTGGHGGLASNANALSSMFAFFESLH